MKTYMLYGSNFENNDIDRDTKSTERHLFNHKPNQEVINILLNSEFKYMHCYVIKNSKRNFESTFGPLIR